MNKRGLGWVLAGAVLLNGCERVSNTWNGAKAGFSIKPTPTASPETGRGHDVVDLATGEPVAKTGGKEVPAQEAQKTSSAAVTTAPLTSAEAWQMGGNSNAGGKIDYRQLAESAGKNPDARKPYFLNANGERVDISGDAVGDTNRVGVKNTETVETKPLIGIRSLENGPVKYVEVLDKGDHYEVAGNFGDFYFIKKSNTGSFDGSKTIFRKINQ